MTITRIQIVKLVLLITISLHSFIAYSHPGGLNGNGCHNNRKNGDYHCHGTTNQNAQLNTYKNPVVAPSRLVSTPKTVTRNTLPPGCYIGPKGGTYTITKSGRKNYSGC